MPTDILAVDLSAQWLGTGEQPDCDVPKPDADAQPPLSDDPPVPDGDSWPGRLGR